MQSQTHMVGVWMRSFTEYKLMLKRVAGKLKQKIKHSDDDWKNKHKHM